MAIIWRMFVSEKSQEVKVWSVRNFNSDRDMLLFGMRNLIIEKRVKNFTLFFNVGSDIFVVMKNRMYAWYFFSLLSLTVTSNTFAGQWVT